MTGFCVVCGAPLNRGTRYCSRACAGKARQNYRTCVICGKEFACAPAFSTRTCSQECSRQHHANLSRSYPHTARMLAARDVSPVLNPDEQHANAKTWVILSPDGATYECRNLLYWCREHADIIPGTPRQMWDGLTKIKYSALGKRKGKSVQYKGWRLLRWGE